MNELIWLAIVSSTITCGTHLKRNCDKVFTSSTSTGIIEFVKDHRISDVTFYKAIKQIVNFNNEKSSESKFTEILDNVENNLIKNDYENFCLSINSDKSESLYRRTCILKANHKGKHIPHAHFNGECIFQWGSE